MHPEIRRLYSGKDAELADSFLRSFHHQGISAEKALAAARWYRESGYANKRRIDYGDIARSFDMWASREGWHPQEIEGAFAWHSTITQAGGDPGVIREIQVDQEAADRQLAEIRQILKTDRARYHREGWDDRYAALLEGRAGASTQIPRQTSGTGSISRSDWSNGGAAGAGQDVPALPAPNEGQST